MYSIRCSVLTKPFLAFTQTQPKGGTNTKAKDGNHTTKIKNSLSSSNTITNIIISYYTQLITSHTQVTTRLPNYTSVQCYAAKSSFVEESQAAVSLVTQYQET